MATASANGGVTLANRKNRDTMMQWVARERHFQGPPTELEAILQGSGVYPLKSNDFWRIRGCDPASIAAADQGAHWHCASCAGRWTSGEESPTRLLVLGQSGCAEIDLDSEDRAFCIYLGNLTPAQENLFSFLKANVLARQLDSYGLPINRKSLLQAIRDLNNACEHRFGQDARVVTLRSANPRLHPTWG